MKKKGFTLIELMIVVAIIGVLAAVAIPSFMRFIRKSKTTEAHLNIRAIANGGVAWFTTEHNDTAGDPMHQHFPTQNSPTGYPPNAPANELTVTPSAAICGSTSRGPLFVKNTQRWNVYPWLALKFSISKAHYYTYNWDVTGTGRTSSAEVVAAGDLDCDGVLSRHAVSLVVSSSDEVEISQIYTILELE